MWVIIVWRDRRSTIATRYNSQSLTCRAPTADPLNVSDLSMSSEPTSSCSPPGRYATGNSLNVIARRLLVMSERWIPCFHLYRASPPATIRHRRGNATATSTSGSVSMVIVCTVDDRRFSVTSRSPHIQKSSKCGSIDEPLSGVYSRLHSSTGMKPPRTSCSDIRSTNI